MNDKQAVASFVEQSSMAELNAIVLKDELVHETSQRQRGQLNFMIVAVLENGWLMLLGAIKRYLYFW